VSYVSLPNICLRELKDENEFYLNGYFGNFPQKHYAVPRRALCLNFEKIQVKLFHLSLQKVKK